MRLGLKRRRKHKSAIGVLLFSVLLFIGFIFVILIRLQPTFIDCAEKYADNIANRLVNSAVDSVYSDDRYEGLSEIREGNIKTVETNTAKINRLKSELNQTITDNLNENETVYIPIGSAFNVYFLLGEGVKIPIRICPISVVNTEIKDEFTSAGINQVYHKIYLEVTVEMSFVGLLTSDKRTVTTTALVNETVIIGDTPQYYGTGEVAVE